MDDRRHRSASGTCEAHEATKSTKSYTSGFVASYLRVLRESRRPVSPAEFQRDADSVVFLRGSDGAAFFTYLSSHAAHRAHRSSRVSFEAGPWSSSG